MTKAARFETRLTDIFAIYVVWFAILSGREMSQKVVCV
ncbi:MAG: hypothetical protein ACI814_003684 [Mariniblastus sp.]|jgi:hypothetical protein